MCAGKTAQYWRQFLPLLQSIFTDVNFKVMKVDHLAMFNIDNVSNMDGLEHSTDDPTGW